jgi:hypothetical protein
MDKMEKKFNFTESLTYLGSKSLDKSKRLQNQANEYLQKYYEGLREDESLKEAAAKEALIGGAAFTQSSAYMRNKNRTQLAEQSIKYNNRASTIVMTDILSNIVEEALLMDIDEFAELNPAYKVNIRETVLAFLENANLNQSIKDKRTLKIMEHIARNLPDVKTGIYLKEDEIVDIIKRSTPDEINGSIDSLVGDVKERVANLVSDEQKAEEELQDQIDEIIAVSEEAKAKRIAKMEKQEQDKEINQEIEKEKAGVIPEEIPEAELDAPEVDEEDEEDDKEETKKDDSVKISKDKDGKIEVSVKESFIREYPRKGILETFAFNEAMEMIEEGREYNGDLALANAIMYITILETFNATGLMKISPVEYKKIAER